MSRGQLPGGYPKAYAEIVDLLTRRACSLDEMAAASGICRDSASAFVKLLRDRDRAHIERWGNDKRGRATIAMWRMGQGIDAKRRPAMSGSKRTALWAESKEPKSRPARKPDKNPLWSFPFTRSSE